MFVLVCTDGSEAKEGAAGHAMGQEPPPDEDFAEAAGHALTIQQNRYGTT